MVSVGDFLLENIQDPHVDQRALQMIASGGGVHRIRVIEPFLVKPSDTMRRFCVGYGEQVYQYVRAVLNETEAELFVTTKGSITRDTDDALIKALTYPKSNLVTWIYDVTSLMSLWGMCIACARLNTKSIDKLRPLPNPNALGIRYVRIIPTNLFLAEYPSLINNAKFTLCSGCDRICTSCEEKTDITVPLIVEDIRMQRNTGLCGVCRKDNLSIVPPPKLNLKDLRGLEKRLRNIHV